MSPKGGPDESPTPEPGSEERGFRRAFRDHGGLAQIVIGVVTTVAAAALLSGFGLLARAWLDDPDSHVVGTDSESSSTRSGPSNLTTLDPTTRVTAAEPFETVTPRTEPFVYLPGDGLPVVQLARVSGLGNAAHIVATEEIVLVLTEDGTHLIEINPNTGTEVRRQVVNAGVQVADMVYAEGTVWTASMDNMAIVQLDPYSSERTSISLDVTPSGLAVSTDTRQIFVISEQSNLLLRVDLNTSTVTGFLEIERPAAIIEGPGGEIWVSSRTTETVVHVDPDPSAPLRTVETIPVSFGAASMTTYQSSVWVANVEAGTISRIGVSTNGASTVEEEQYPGVTLDRLLAVKDLVWIFDFHERMIILSGSGFNELEQEPVDVRGGWLHRLGAVSRRGRCPANVLTATEATALLVRLFVRRLRVGTAGLNV